MFQFGDFEFDTRHYRLKKNGTAVEMEPQSI